MLDDNKQFKSTVEKGDFFRDRLRDLLTASGYIDTQTEVRIGSKKVDVLAVRYEITGPIREGFEAKYYEGNITKGHAREFINDYSGLTKTGQIDSAWLISQNDISPSARDLIKENISNKLYCATIAEFEGRLFPIDQVQAAIEKEYKASKIEHFFVDPRASDGTKIEEYTFSWIDNAKARQLAIIGGYGKGKSTFALHLANKLSVQAKTGAMSRLPILIRLGQISDEQSIEGLFGKELAGKSDYRVQNYHFETLKELNRRGRFVIIYDGFDEMKYGMTFTDFHRTFKNLMSLDEGDAKIVILGRETALHNDQEFRTVIKGKSFTANDREIKSREFRGCDHLTIEQFTPQETQSFIARYFPIQANEEARFDERITKQWIAMRIKEIQKANADGIAARPVHAQMLCDIATDPDNDISELSTHDLYDQFLHHLMERETGKAGRDPRIPITHRRRFAARLAAWLWKQGGASTTSLNDIPDSLIKIEGEKIPANYDDLALRRELIAGSLVEKSDEKIYFGHRSIQEFLVAEYLSEHEFDQKLKLGMFTDKEVWDAVTPEVGEFLFNSIRSKKGGLDYIPAWFSSFDRLNNQSIPFSNIKLLADLHGVKRTSNSLANLLSKAVDNNSSLPPSVLWAEYVSANKVVDWQTNAHLNTDCLALEGVSSGTIYNKLRISAQLYWAYNVSSVERPNGAKMLASILPIEDLNRYVSMAYQTKNVYVKKDKDPALWIILQSLKIVFEKEKILCEINLKRLIDLSSTYLGKGFSFLENSPSLLNFPIQNLFIELQEMGWTKGKINYIRPYIENKNVRGRIHVLNVETRKKINT